VKIGYPCINNSILRTVPTTFRLASYSENRLVQTVSSNLTYFNQILEYNVKHGLLFFRISSDLIPFASHPICKLNWYEHFQSEFEEIGSFIGKHNIRISMHPDQFVILNSPNSMIIKSSISELKYHCNVLDAMKLDETAKVQIHIGGVYGNKIESLKRFVTTYNTLNDAIRRRLVIENDDRLYHLNDCLELNRQINIPIVFDSFHHELLSDGELLKSAFRKATSTWDKNKDGSQIVDYSNAHPENGEKSFKERKGKHAESIDITSFKKFLKETAGLDFDVMLEIKDKEKSALKALIVLNSCRNGRLPLNMLRSNSGSHLG
jgi:UV DNA damage endonuclease